jgi:hypothetical protein
MKIRKNRKELNSKQLCPFFQWLFYKAFYTKESSVSDPGCLSRIQLFSIPDPNCLHPGSDPQHWKKVKKATVERYHPARVDLHESGSLEKDSNRYSIDLYIFISD